MVQIRQGERTAHPDARLVGQTGFAAKAYCAALDATDALFFLQQQQGRRHLPVMCRNNGLIGATQTFFHPQRHALRSGFGKRCWQVQRHTQQIAVQRSLTCKCRSLIAACQLALPRRWLPTVAPRKGCSQRRSSAPAPGCLRWHPAACCRHAGGTAEHAQGNVLCAQSGVGEAQHTADILEYRHAMCRRQRIAEEAQITGQRGVMCSAATVFSGRDATGCHRWCAARQ